jgi:hypothetical protein
LFELGVTQDAGNESWPHAVRDVGHGVMTMKWALKNGEILGGNLVF